MNKKLKLIFFFNFFLLTVDRLTKNYFLNNPSLFCQKFLCLQLSKNKNLFFLPFNQNLIIFFATLILLFLIWQLIKNWSRKKVLLSLGLLLLIFGGISNLYDRIFLGFVVDFISTPLWPFSVFNLADLMIVVGIIFLGLSYLPLRKINEP